MKISINPCGAVEEVNRRGNAVSFKAGKTILISDHDGTYMPLPYKHDSICRSKPPIDKIAFQEYFDRFKAFITAIKGTGSESKFWFSLTTGRNVHEFNYYLRKIREQGLTIPLPDSVITCNGQDEFYLRKDTPDYFKSSFRRAFLENDVNLEKREWIKKLTGGWDGDVIRKYIKDILSNPGIVIPLDATDKMFFFAQNGTKIEPDTIAHELINSNKTEEEMRHHIEEIAKPLIESKTGKERDDFLWAIGEYAHELFEIRNGKYRFHVLEAQTNQTMGSYGDDMSLQSKLKKMNPPPKYYASIRQDGNLGFHIALNDYFSTGRYFLKERDNDLSLYRIIQSYLRSQNIRAWASQADEDGEARTIKGEKGQSIRVVPFGDNACELQKVHDVVRKAREITDKGLNDLIIAAGDRKNDAEMFNLFNYIDNGYKTLTADIGQALLNPDYVEQLKKVPVIAIYVDTAKITGKKPPISPAHYERFFNFDGNIRFIHVDPKDPKKPQNLLEAVHVAVKEYARRNPKFRENLTQEMRDIIDKMDYVYPTVVTDLVPVTGSGVPDIVRDKVGKPEVITDKSKLIDDGKVGKPEVITDKSKLPDIEDKIRDTLGGVKKKEPEVGKELIETSKKAGNKKIIIPALLLFGAISALAYKMSKKNNDEKTSPVTVTNPLTNPLTNPQIITYTYPPNINDYVFKSVKERRQA